MWLLQLSTTDNHNVAIMGGIAIRSYYTNMSLRSKPFETNEAL